MRLALQLGCLFLFMLTSAALRAAPQVVVLQVAAPGFEEWPQGNQAVIAELVASSYELVVRASVSVSQAELEGELTAAGRSPSTVGALAVLRYGSSGLAIVYTPRSGLKRLEVKAVQGTVAESRLALGVVELLRTLQLPAERERRPPPPAVRAPPASAEPRSDLQVRAGGGLAFSSGAGNAFPLLMIGGSRRLAGPFGVDLELRATPLTTRVETSAGGLDVRAEQLGLHLMFSTTSSRHFNLALGLGGGALLLQTAAVDSPRFTGQSSATQVAVLSTLARASARAGSLMLSLVLEPGVTLPAVSVRAESDVVERFGRPWVCTTIGLGWEL